MSSNKFNTTIVFNGEIFNHVECRQNLEKEGVYSLQITPILK